MAYNKPVQPINKVTYFKHFPHHFIRPYDAQLLLNQGEFLQKLTPKNCEWLTRPKIAMSEAAQALRQNWEIISGSQLIDAQKKTELEQLIAPMNQSLLSLDTKDKTSVATDQDVYNAMNWCFENPQLDASLGQMMQESAALYVFLTQLRAMRTIITKPANYADKIVNDAPEAIAFKNGKTIALMQTMLSAMCVTSTQPEAASSTDVRALAWQLVNPANPNAPAAAPQRPAPPPTPGLVNPGNPMQNPSGQQQTAQLPANNQTLDIILQLQAQMQAMEEQLSQQPGPSTQPPAAGQKRRTPKRKAPTPEPEQPDPEDAPAKEPQQPPAEQPVEVEPPKKKKTKKNKK